jgi:hypothetical protein
MDLDAQPGLIPHDTAEPASALPPVQMLPKESYLSESVFQEETRRIFHCGYQFLA